MREAAIARAVRAEVDLMGTMQTYNDAFRFLHRLKWRLEQDDARRLLANTSRRPTLTRVLSRAAHVDEAVLRSCG